MAAHRANWKGFLMVGEVSCPVALYTAASTAERVSFHMVNRKTGNRLRRVFVDAETEKPVEREDQVKGYEVDKDRFVILDPDEIEQAVPEVDKTLAVTAFIACGDVDTTYFDKPYYLAPSSGAAKEAFAVIREALKKKSVAALARAVLFRRVRSLLIRAHDKGLVANTLNFDYEVRSANDAFEGIRDIKIKGEMLDLAKHIIGTKMGEFDPSSFDDRYENAVSELVKLKIEGKAIPKRKAVRKAKVVDLMEALRASAGSTSRASAGATSSSKTGRKRAAGARKKTPAGGRRKAA